MRTFYKIALTLLMLVNITYSKAQIPVNDPSSWTLQPNTASGGTEDFNSSLDFTNKWNAEVGPGLGGEYKYAANLIQTGTTLKIKADTLIPGVPVNNSTRWNNTPPNYTVTYVYQGGILSSKNKPYKFGYLEISAKYPTGYYPLWPAFWLWSSDCPADYYNEIDICENADEGSYNGQIMASNVHVNTDTCQNNNGFDFPNSANVGQTLSNGFHKYAIQWAPDRIIWYFDDVPVRTFYESGTNDTVPQNAMYSVLNFAVFPWAAYLPADWNIITQHGNHPASWPQYFEINYLNYYKLSPDCNANLTLCVPGDYDRKVKKSIITNTACTPTYNPGAESSSYTLRATDYVTIDAGTTISPTGTGYFAIDIMDCPQ